MKPSSFRDVVVTEIKNMLGIDKVEPYSSSGIKELLKDNPHLVTFQDFNEILTYLGERKCTDAFFTEYFRGGFQSVDELSKAVTRVRTYSLLFHGNFTQGFRALSQSNERQMFERVPWDIEIGASRHMTTDRIEPLTAEQAHATGYLVGQENPLNARQKREARGKAKNNAQRYLAMNGVDVYIAGSMRALPDFREADAFVREVRSQPQVRSLGLSFFNPLWAYMEDSQQKGLLEQLMLKKARAMVYLAGTYDSFGKDSELASMLVQGKPVVVYVPLASVPPPSTGGNSQEYQQWEKVRDILESRFKAFSITHPLRLQCDLRTGVANGIMVCRDCDICAKLLYGIFTNNMEFYLDDSDSGNYFLREKLTGSAVRVVTRDQMLTSSFWNQWQSI